jgi:hypothetical protein
LARPRRGGSPGWEIRRGRRCGHDGARATSAIATSGDSLPTALPALSSRRRHHGCQWVPAKFVRGARPRQTAGDDWRRSQSSSASAAAWVLAAARVMTASRSRGARCGERRYGGPRWCPAGCARHCPSGRPYGTPENRHPPSGYPPQGQRRNTQRPWPRLPRCLPGLTKTRTKLGVALWDYLGSRRHVVGQRSVPPLPGLVRCHGQPA